MSHEPAKLAIISYLNRKKPNKNQTKTKNKKLILIFGRFSLGNEYYAVGVGGEHWLLMVNALLMSSWMIEEIRGD